MHEKFPTTRGVIDFWEDNLEKNVEHIEEKNPDKCNEKLVRIIPIRIRINLKIDLNLIPSREF